MASFTDLFTVTTDAALLDRVAVAVAIAANNINEESAAVPYHDRRRRWAKAALLSPQAYAQAIVWAIMAQYKDATLAQITGATDAQLLTAVETALPVMIEL